ncbi:MAG: hypothetical protein RLZZ450_2322 [Pseudomonadota bacterium]|jgi:DNA-binding NtrC family response regulator
MTTPLRHVATTLVVEDNLALRASLCRAVSNLLSCKVVEAASVAEARDALRDWCPDLLILDVVLTDGTAFDVLALLEESSKAPAVIGISGVAGPEAAFRLAQLGIRRYVQKPIDLPGFEAAIREALEDAPDLKPYLRAAVGRIALHQLEDIVRTTMLNEALARSEGNRRGAARILQVSRQLLQHMLRRTPSSL